MLSQGEVRRLPCGAIVVDEDGDILIKADFGMLSVLSSDMDDVGDSYHVGIVYVVAEIGGDHEARIRAALAEIDAVRQEIGDMGRP